MKKLEVHATGGVSRRRCGTTNRFAQIREMEVKTMKVLYGHRRCWA